MGFGRWAVPLVIALLSGCAATVDDASDGSSDALTTLSASSCKEPEIKTSPRARDGKPIDGSAHTTVAGCLVGRPNETGVALVSRIQDLLGDTVRFAKLTDTGGAPVFSKFEPQEPTGTLSEGLVQDVDVELALDHSPSTRLRVVRRLLESGSYELTITNVTAMRASLGFLPITVIDPGNLSVKLVARPEANGVTINGTGDVTLDVSKEKAEKTSQLVQDVFVWLDDQLHR